MSRDPKLAFALKTAREVLRPKKAAGGELYNAQLLGKVGKGTEDQTAGIVAGSEQSMNSKLKDAILEQEKERSEQPQDNWGGNGGGGDGSLGGLGDTAPGGGYGGTPGDSAGGSPAGDGGGTMGGADLKRGGAAKKGTVTKVKPHVGPIHSPVAGRTDHLPMHVKSGSYVIPADIISAMGEGNTMAGFKNAKMLFGGQVYKSSGPDVTAGSPYGAELPKAAGGPATDGELVPIIAAGGEYVIGPENVMVIGGGDLDHGHKILDSFVKKMRAKTISTLKKLPGPKKD